MFEPLDWGPVRATRNSDSETPQQRKSAEGFREALELHLGTTNSFTCWVRTNDEGVCGLKFATYYLVARICHGNGNASTYQRCLAGSGEGK
jgi:hypothetical protein